jgi:hypothetical protein
VNIRVTGAVTATVILGGCMKAAVTARRFIISIHMVAVLARFMIAVHINAATMEIILLLLIPPLGNLVELLHTRGILPIWRQF